MIHCIIRRICLAVENEKNKWNQMSHKACYHSSCVPDRNVTNHKKAVHKMFCYSYSMVYMSSHRIAIVDLCVACVVHFAYNLHSWDFLQFCRCENKWKRRKLGNNCGIKAHFPYLILAAIHSLFLGMIWLSHWNHIFHSKHHLSLISLQYAIQSFHFPHALISKTT